MPRVCAQAVLGLLIAAISATPARAAEDARHLGLYLARTTSTGTKPVAPAELPMVASAITATARGPLVEVVTTQTFTNTGKHTIEAVYVFPLPPDAAISAMTIKVGTKTIHAAIEARDKALTRHEAAVAAGVAGAVLEQDRPDVFTQSITGIAAGATVEVELRWDTIATRLDGVWELAMPLVVAPRAVPGTATGRGVVGSGTSPDTDRSPDASRVTPPRRDDGTGTTTTFTLVLDEKATDVTSPSHELAVKTGADKTTITTTDDRSARDLVVRWKTKPRPRGWVETGDGSGFAAVTIEAGPHKGKAQPVHAVIAVDDDGAVGSEAALVGHKVERAVIEALGRRDRVAVRPRGGDFVWDAPAAEVDTTPSASSRHDLVRLLERISAAVDQSDEPVQIVLVTDGLVADQAAVLRAAIAIAQPIHVVGVGAAPNRSLVGAIAAATGGTARFVDPDRTGPIAKAVVADLRHPVAAPVIEWGELEVTDVIPATLPRLGAGQAITVLARTTVDTRGAKAKGKVAGGAGGVLAIEVDARPAVIAGATSPQGVIGRLWARARLGELIAAQASSAEVTKLALAYGLVSPYTAMIAVGEDVVDRNGTQRTVSVPVAIPSGMKWQARFAELVDGKNADDDQLAKQKAKAKEKEEAERRRQVAEQDRRDATRAEQGQDGRGGGGGGDGAQPTSTRRAKDKPAEPAPDAAAVPATGDTAGTGAPPPVVDGHYSLDVTTESSDGDAEDAGDEGESQPDASPGVSQETLAITAGSLLSTRGRAGVYVALRAGGGLTVLEDERRGMGTIGARAGLRFGMVAVGGDLSLWAVGSDLDLAVRPEIMGGLVGLAGWIDLTIGAGLHVADDVGPAYSVGLRVGRGRLGAVLRWDGAQLRGDDDAWRSVNTFDLNLETEF
jgi:Ca-activated chloride channel family protein